jgi:hypothetical protein
MPAAAKASLEVDPLSALSGLQRLQRAAIQNTPLNFSHHSSVRERIVEDEQSKLVLSVKLLEELQLLPG